MSLDRKAFIDILGEGQGDIGTAMLPAPEGQWAMPKEMREKLPGYDPELGSVEIWDSPKQGIVIQAWDGPICAKRRPVGENGAALPGEEVGPRSQRRG
jgi:hypothetical protein